MIDVNIVAKRVNSVYRIPLDLGMYGAALKWDTGAKYSVISVGAIEKDLSADHVRKIKTFCEAHCQYKEQFVSASGDTFWGYKVTANQTMLGETEFDTFHYYLVVENKRDIALLGFDFIDNCKGIFYPHSNIIVTEFDEVGYREERNGLNSDELVAFIDSLTNEG